MKGVITIMTVKKVRKAKPAARRATPASRSTAPSLVNLILNGQPQGTVDPTGLTIAQAANNLAKAHGIKSYSILLNGGMKVTTDEAGAALAGATSLEVFAKETRG